MCGITGIFDTSCETSLSHFESTITAMRDSLSHRGPDHAGNWYDPTSGIALGHRRLSIMDLSPLGEQPMISVNDRWVLAFNGEIYNHLELRNELEITGSAFRGHSDTEVLLEAISNWGIQDALYRSRGMFALAIWDRREKHLHMARDRLGEKPLYFYQKNGLFLFASESKALQKHPDFIPEVNRDVLSLYMRHNYIPAPYSIYRNVNQLQAGCWMTVNLRGEVSEQKPYWQMTEGIISAHAQPFMGNEAEAIDQVESILLKSVEEMMVSDVPLGAMLSGGIDSSSIVALMQSLSDTQVRTFCIGYDEPIYNEASHAAQVANHLGTSHTELNVRPSDALEIIPSLPDLYDEPFADASQLPTAIISRMIREHVTVALTGDGGDEVFGGYNRYFWAQRLAETTGWVPASIRRLFANCVRWPSPAAWDHLFSVLEPVLPRALRVRLPGDKLHKLADVMGFADNAELYRSLVTHWPKPEQVVIGAQEPAYLPLLEKSMPEQTSFTREMMYLDTMSYLPGDILTKVDRASMGFSLETRVPFLDHRVIECAWQMPLEYLIKNGQGKWLLRKILHKHVPAELVERPKMGFAVPLDMWLRGPLRDWAENLLDESRLRQDGFFEPELVRKKWQEHLSGRRNWQYHLWSVLMFQSWKSRWV